MRRFTSALRALFASTLVLSLVCPASGFADPPVDRDEAVILRPGQIPEIDVEVGSAGEEYVPGEVIVKFKSGISPVAARRAHGLLGSVHAGDFAVRGLELARIASGKDVLATVRAYEAMPEVEYAQPNYIFRVATVPDDVYFSDLWGLHNTGQTGGMPDADIDAPEAWDITTGSQSVTVAVVDTGIDYYHPDFGDNLWVNPNEVPNGLDDDGNGYVDDIHGCDTYYLDGDPYDSNGHGTHVAGTVGAQGNDALGVSGVDWDVSILSVKAAGAMGVFTTSAVLKAFAYIEDTDARVINCSWGGPANDLAQYDAIAAMPDRLFVCAAGNNGQDLEATNFYPAGYDLPNILSVAASDASDARVVSAAWSSNFGATRTDLFAPGDDIVSTWRCPLRQVVASDATVNTIFRDEFADLSAWIQAPYPAKTMHPWVTDGTHVVSPPSSAANIEYGNNQGTWLIASQLIDISSADVPGMRFHVRIDSAPGDYLQWGAYNAVTGASTIFGTVSGDNLELQEVAVNLSMYAGSTAIQPWFRFLSDSAVNSADGYGGVWVDDFEVFDIDTGSTGTPWDYEPWVPAYAISGGTSMAAPHAAGVAGLLLARNPALTSQELKQAIMDGVDTPPALAGLCVTDGRLNAYGAVVAANRAPDVTEDGAITAEDTSAVFNVLANDIDVEGDPIAAELTRGVSVGTLVLSPSGEAAYAPPADWSGVTSFAYRAFDGFAYSGPVDATITVAPVNDAPVAVGDAYGTIEGGRLTVPASAGVLGNDTDIDSDSPSLIAMRMTPPAHGALALGADGGFTYVPAPGFSGTDSFSYAAHDGVVASAPVLVTIRVAARRVWASGMSTGSPEDAVGASPEATSSGMPSAAVAESGEESEATDDAERLPADEDGAEAGGRYIACGVAVSLLLVLALGLLLALKRRTQREDEAGGNGAKGVGEPDS